MEDGQQSTQQLLQELHTTRPQLVRLQSLMRLNQLISSSLDLDEVLHEIARATATLLEAPVSSFWLAHEATRTLEFHSSSHERAGADWPIAKISFDQGGAGWVAAHRAVLNVPDVFADERMIGRYWFQAHGLQSSLMVPIVLGDDLLAVLAMARTEPFHLDADDQYVLDNLSTQAAVAIRNARLYRDSEEQRRHLTTLVDVAQRLTRGLELPTVLQAIVEAAALVFTGEASLRLLEGETLVRVAATPGSIASSTREHIRLGESLSGYAALSSQPLLVTDMAVDARLSPDVRAALRGERFRALLCVPIRIGSHILGTLQVYRERDHHFDQHALTMATSLADQAAIAIENARLFQEAQAQATQLVQANAALQGEIVERQRTEAALRESEARYRTLIEGSLQGMLIHQDSINRFANTAMARMLGYDSPQDLIGQDFQLHIAPHERMRLMSYRDAHLRGEPAPVLSELQGIKQDGSLLWLESLTSVVAWNGHPAILSTYVDFTERRRLAAQLRQAQKMEALGTLAGGIAHDFNNILAAILGYTELVSFSITPGTLEWHHLQQVLIAGERATRLVQQILAFSRQSEHKRQPVCLSPIVQETLALLRASLPSTIELRQSLAADSGMVLADPTQLQQVIMNLCTNAEHAMRPKGGRLEVCLDSVNIDMAMATAMPELAPGPHVRLMVRDSGHGMTPEVLERIFDPFFTTKSPGEGTGMGLAVVHGIVTSYAGAITVASTPDQGTTVVIYLPRFDSVVEETPHAPETLSPGHGSILFVDDEAALAHLAQEMLERLGYTAEAYASSHAALAAFQAAPRRFDLVITDQTMPDLSGETLVRDLRHIRPDIPIILCTGFSHTMAAENAAALGIDAFLMKPLVLHELGLAIQRVLAARTTPEGLGADG